MIESITDTGVQVTNRNMFHVHLKIDSVDIKEALNQFRNFLKAARLTKMPVETAEKYLTLLFS